MPSSALVGAVGAAGPVTPTDTTIAAVGLTKSFGATPVLRGVDLAVPRGTMLALLGPNGAGKTTTVRIISTLIRADGGTATVGGHDIAREPAAVRRLVGLTGQYTSVDGLLTGEENLVMIGQLYHLGSNAAKRRAHDLLERFELVDAARKPVKLYSGGMRRRLDLAGSLIARPPILFLDEPTIGLDPRGRRAIWDVIRTLMDEGTTFLLTTQYLDEADQLADNIAVIDDGRILAEGSAAALKRRVGVERVHLTFGDADDKRRAASLLEGSGTVAVESTTRISVGLDGASHLRHLLNLLGDAGLEPSALAVAAPTLDDVFLAVTGVANTATTPGTETS